MKHFLVSLSTGLLLTLAAINLPAVSQPAASPSSSASQGDRFSNNPLLRGVTLTAQQKSQLVKIEQESSSRIKQMLTPAQRKLVMTKGPSAVQLTEPQKKKYVAISKEVETKTRAVFTPEQMKQILSNAQSIKGSSGQSPSGSPSSTQSPSSSPK